MAIETMAYGRLMILHDADTSVPKKRRGQAITVRTSSIDAVLPRASYTTLSVGGHYQHVKESAEEIVKLMEREAAARSV